MGYDEFGSGEIQGPPTNDPAPVTQELLQKYINRDEENREKVLPIYIPTALSTGVFIVGGGDVSIPIRVPADAPAYLSASFEVAVDQSGAYTGNCVLDARLGTGGDEGISATSKTYGTVPGSPSYTVFEFSDVPIDADLIGTSLSLRIHGVRQSSEPLETVTMYVRNNINANDRGFGIRFHQEARS